MLQLNYELLIESMTKTNQFRFICPSVCPNAEITKKCAVCSEKALDALDCFWNCGESISRINYMSRVLAVTRVRLSLTGWIIPLVPQWRTNTLKQ